jgi:hypothetical protein
MSKLKPCTAGSRHTWEWSHDVTHRTIRDTMGGTLVTLSRRGWYKCRCGENRLGQPRSGL